MPLVMKNKGIEESRADRRQPVLEDFRLGAAHEHGDHHPGGIGAKNKLHPKFIGERDEAKQNQNRNSNR